MSDILNTSSARKAFGIGAFCAALACTVIRIIAIIFFFDSDIAYYESGKIIPIISYAAPIAAILAAAVLCFIPKMRISAAAAYDTAYTRVSAIFPSLGFAVFSLIYILSLIEYSKLQVKIPISFIICAICSVAACAFFALRALGRSASGLCVICGILTILWLVLALAENYFDTFVPMNSPLKTVFQFACLAGMLFILCEMRMSIDKKRTRLHLFSSAAALILMPLSAIPSLLGFFIGTMPVTYTLVYYDITLAAISVLACTRVINLCFGKEQRVEQAITENNLTEQE